MGRPEPSRIYTVPGVPSDSPYIKAISWFHEFVGISLDDLADYPMTRLDCLLSVYSVYWGMHYNDLYAGDHDDDRFLNLIWQTFS